jgi:hypothetical protein
MQISAVLSVETLMVVEKGATRILPVQDQESSADSFRAAFEADSIALPSEEGTST